MGKHRGVGNTLDAHLVRRLPGTCVNKVQQNLEYPGIHSQDLHLILVGLLHPYGEQGTEVGAAGGQHEPMNPENPLADSQPHITEVRAEPHPVHLGQDDSRVAVRCKGNLLG